MAVVVAMSEKISAYRYRDFNLLFTSRMMGTIGIQMLTVAIGWHIYDITGDALALGLVGLSQFLPSLLLVLLAGEAADQYDRKKVMGLAYLLAGLCAVFLAVVAYAGSQDVWPIYFAAVCLGIMRIFGSPATQALLPNVVPKEAFSHAVAINSAGFQIAIITGPVFAGFAIAGGNVVVYAAAAFALMISAILSFCIRTSTPTAKRPLDLRNLLAGFNFVRRRPIMLGAISLDLLAVFFGGVVALLPIFAKDILQVGPEGLGFLRCAPAIGSAVMAFYLARKPIQARAGVWMLSSVMVFGIVTIIFALSRDFYLSMAMMIALGAADMVSVYVRTHLMQYNTPDEMRGRVASVNMLFITASNELGDFESGLTASWFGVVPAAVLGGIMAIVVAGMIAWRVPSFRNLNKLEDST